MAATSQVQINKTSYLTPVQALPYKVSFLLGIPIASLSYQQVLNHLEENVQKKRKCLCVTLNLDILRMTYENESFLNIVKEADFIFADGMPIIWLSKLSAHHTETTAPLPERVPGCDIVQDMCRLSHEKGYKLYILGAGPGVAEIAKKKLEKKLPNIKIVGTYCPSSAELQDEKSSNAIIDHINASSADVLFIALGAPKQEAWAHKHRNKLAPYLTIPCGGSIDFIAGVQKKSPKWIGKLGFEWVFRMAYDPQRMFKRYILNDLPFLLKAYYKNQFGIVTQ